MSAWIEITHVDASGAPDQVALLVSAWIEMKYGAGIGGLVGGRTPCECVD